MKTDVKEVFRTLALGDSVELIGTNGRILQLKKSGDGYVLLHPPRKYPVYLGPEKVKNLLERVLPLQSQ